jgi:TonB family protein
MKTNAPNHSPSFFMLPAFVHSHDERGYKRGLRARRCPGRKAIHKTMPVYPALARQSNLAGTVKVVAIVAPDGKVKTVEAVGGSPILIEAAKDAIGQWKFAPAPAESREVIELHFNP